MLHLFSPQNLRQGEKVLRHRLQVCSGPRTEGSRCRRTSRRRRVHHADARLRKHERAGHNDRRKGSSHDPPRLCQAEVVETGSGGPEVLKTGNVAPEVTKTGYGGPEVIEKHSLKMIPSE